MKTCKSCGETKPLTEFPPQRRLCRLCYAAWLRQYRRDHQDEYRAKQRARWHARTDKGAKQASKFARILAGVRRAS